MEYFSFTLYVLVGLYGLWAAYSILARKNYRFVVSEDNTQLPYAKAVASKFAALYGIGGICVLALPFWLAHKGVPALRWHYSFVGLLGVLKGVHWILVSSHTSRYSPFANIKRPQRGIFYSHNDVSSFSDVVYILDFNKADVYKYGTIGKPTKDKLTCSPN